MASTIRILVAPSVTVLLGDVLDGLSELDDESVQCVVTSPPYWGLRDYGVAGQLGLEATPQEYVCAMVEVFREVRRVLRKDGICWVNMGDSYAVNQGKNAGKQGVTGQRASRTFTAEMLTKPVPDGMKAKDLVGIPWMLAFALRADGWYLRSDIIWSKPNPMPESVTDRPTKSHEYLFLLTKSARYYYDADAIRTPLRPKTFTTFGTVRHDPGDGSGLVKSEKFGRDVPERRPRLLTAKNAVQPAQNGHRRLVESVKMAREAGGDHDQPFAHLAGANARSVWTIATQPYPEAHFATFPEKLVEPCLRAGSKEGDLVLDPFAGSGTTLAVARRLGRPALGIELNPAYLDLIQDRVLGIKKPKREREPDKQSGHGRRHAGFNERYFG